MIVVALLVVMAVPGVALAASPTSPPMLAQAKASPAAPPVAEEAKVLMARGIVDAIDKEKQTITIKARRRSLVLNVRDPRLLDAAKVGTPVVAKFYQSLVLDLKKPGDASAGVSAQQSAAMSKPGDPPAATLGRQVTVTTPIVAVNDQNQTVTVKGPEGFPETARVRDPALLGKFKVGDVVQITYTQRLAVSLEKPTDAPADKNAPADKKQR